MKLEYLLKSRESAFPCEVTVDEDNGRYMIRKADSSGEVFNSPIELIKWVLANWNSDEFYDKKEFDEMINELRELYPTI